MTGAVNFRVAVEGPCPFCKGKWQMGYSHKGEPMGTHTMPMCDEFSDLDLTEFMAATRKRLSAN